MQLYCLVSRHSDIARHCSVYPVPHRHIAGHCLNHPSLKNAPTCYRAPRWPDPEFPRKIPKKYPPGRNSGTPRKYPQNTEKIPKMAWGSRISDLGVFFFGIFYGNSGRAISGLCSRSGRSQPWPNLSRCGCTIESSKSTELQPLTFTNSESQNY